MTIVGPAVCYVISHYTEAGHTAHLPRFLEELSRYADVYVVLWNQEEIPSFPGVKRVFVLDSRGSSRILKVVRLLQVVWRLRRDGCRVFFVRIQYTLALILSLFRKGLGIHVFLWRSGLTSVTRPRLSWRPSNLLASLSWHVREKLVFRSAAWLATGFVTGPSTMADYYQDEYGIPRRKSLLLDNDVDTTNLGFLAETISGSVVREELGVPSDAHLMVYVGSVSARKLGDEAAGLVEVTQELMKRRSDVYLVLVGSLLLGGLKERLGREPWGHRVLFTGSVPLVQVWGYYLAADLGFFPVTEAGFPRILLEAMALGVPFVSFDVGGVRDIVAPEQMSCIVPGGDTRRFLQTVEMLLDDPILRQRLHSVGLDRVKSFSTEVVAWDFFEKFVRPFSGNNQLKFPRSVE